MSGAPSPEADKTARITFRAVFTYLIVEVDNPAFAHMLKKMFILKRYSAEYGENNFRKNPYVMRLRALASDASLRRTSGETVLDGVKLLGEALGAGAEVTGVLCTGGTGCRRDWAALYMRRRRSWWAMPLR